MTTSRVKTGLILLSLAFLIAHAFWQHRMLKRQEQECQTIQLQMSRISEHSRMLESRMASIRRMASHTCVSIHELGDGGLRTFGLTGGVVPMSMVAVGDVQSDDIKEMANDKNLSVANNNYLNVKGESRWTGEVGRDAQGHVQFVHPIYSIRAGALILRSYVRQHGIRTVRGIIDRFCEAPPDLQEQYVNFVAQRLGVGPDDEFPVFNRLPDLLAAMVKFESGVDVPGEWVASFDILKDM